MASPPKLKCLSLDAMHLCFAVDGHTKKHRMRPALSPALPTAVQRPGARSAKLRYTDAMWALGAVLAGDRVAVRRAMRPLWFVDEPRDALKCAVRIFDRGAVAPRGVRAIDPCGSSGLTYQCDQRVRLLIR